MTFIKSRSQELDIPEGNPFENDKLDRSQFSNILTDVVSFYEQKGEAYRKGKLTMAQRLQQDIKAPLIESVGQYAETIYYSDKAFWTRSSAY